MTGRNITHKLSRPIFAIQKFYVYEVVEPFYKIPFVAGHCIAGAGDIYQYPGRILALICAVPAGCSLHSRTFYDWSYAFDTGLYDYRRPGRS